MSGSLTRHIAIHLRNTPFQIIPGGARTFFRLVTATCLFLLATGHLPAQVNPLRGESSVRSDSHGGGNKRAVEDPAQQILPATRRAATTESHPSEIPTTLFRQLENTLFQPRESSPDSSSVIQYSDPNIENAGYESNVNSDSLAPEPSNPDRQLVLVSEDSAAVPSGKGQEALKPPAFSGFRQVPINDTVKKLAINTGLVLVVAVAFLVVMKKRGGGQVNGVSKPQSTPIEIEQTVNLGGKSVLKIVRIGTQQLAIAMDPGGIKSVVTLASGFAETLESVAEEEPIVPPEHWQEIMKHLELARSQAKS